MTIDNAAPAADSTAFESEVEDGDYDLVRSDFLARVRGDIKTKEVKFLIGGKPEWAKLRGVGISANDIAEVNSLEGSDDPDAEEKSLRKMADIIVESVHSWSFPVPCTAEELNSWPQPILFEVWTKITKAGPRLPLDHKRPAKKK